MSASRVSQAEIPNISGADINSAMLSAFGAADGSSAETLQNLTAVHQARLSRMQRRLAQLKSVGASAASLQQAQDAIKAGTQRIAQFSAMQQQASTPPPSVSPDGWVLHGRVLSDSLAPVEHLTVFLVDANKVWQREYGFAYTDNTGYFLINYPGESTSKTPEKQSAPTPKSKTKAASASRTTVAGEQLFVEVSNTQRKPIYLASDPFVPGAGTITYQTIKLAPGQKPIGEPPADLKSTAIPPREKK